MLSKLTPLCILALVCTAVFADQPALEVTSPHFTLITTAGEKPARQILDNFERMRWMFQTLFPKANVDPASPMVVMAVRNKKEFQALAPAEYLAKGQLNLAGYFLGGNDKNLILMRLDAEYAHPFSTVYHEYTHLQFRDAGEWMPLWLNEGIAQFFQNTDFHDKQVLLGEASPEDILYLRQNQLIPLDVLFRVDHNSPYYHQENKGSVFYAESWALTHYLEVTDRQNHTERLSQYMTLMSQHTDTVVAAQKAFGDLSALQKQLGFYIQQSQYKQFVLNSAAAPIDSSTYKVRTLTAPEFDANRADFLAYIGRTDEARILLEAIMKADPKNAQARETMGYIAFRAGDHETARKWFGEAIDLDSRSYLANYYFAAMSLNSADASQYPRIESTLRAAIRLNANYAPAYDLLARWLVNRHDKLDEAESLELKAIHLDPTNLTYRLNAANLLILRERYDAAKQLLVASQKIARTPQEALMIASHIQDIAGIRKSHEQNEATMVTIETGSVDGTVVTTSDPAAKRGSVQTVAIDPDSSEVAPRHPAGEPNGPEHTLVGTLAEVRCYYPSYLDLQVTVKGNPKVFKLYVNNYYRLDINTLGFDLPGAIDPCVDISGMHAKILYAEMPDDSTDGQIISIELHK